MDEKIIQVQNFGAKNAHPSGFTTWQFKKLDALYLKSAAQKILTYRTVECDFEEKTASYTYYKSQNQHAYIQFIIRQVGPRTMMYEVYKQNTGRIAKSGLFERAYIKLREEIEKLDAVQ